MQDLEQSSGVQLFSLNQFTMKTFWTTVTDGSLCLKK